MIKIISRPIRILLFFFQLLYYIKITKNYKKTTLIIQKMGPAFIKLGQAFSTRSDLINQDLSCELIKLCDSTKKYKFKLMKKYIEKELDSKIEDVFLSFDENCIYSASISQIYKAKLKNGENVAVKILHPNIESKFFLDLNILRTFIKIISPFINQRLNIIKIIDRFYNASKFELNLKIEAANCSELKENNIKKQNKVIIPNIYWNYSSKRLLITEWIEGTNLTKIENITEDTTKNLILLFFSQVYEDGFFHGDFHMGNILITEENNIALVDFGIMGRLDIQDRLYLARITKSFFNKDYQSVADIHFEANYILQKDPFFVSTCRVIGETMVNKKLKDISIAKVLKQLFYTAYTFNIEIQPQLLLLQKNMMMLEGICKKLSPDTNMWKIVTPLIKKWLRKNIVKKYKTNHIKNTFDTFNRTVQNINQSLETGFKINSKKNIFTFERSLLIAVIIILVITIRM